MIADPEEFLAEFIKHFKTAVQSIPASCFYLERYGDESEDVMRERVYCYEIYHQLRQLLSKDFPYILHGEVDKRGHDIIRERLGSDGFIPDFIVHKPRGVAIGDNLAIVEVKTIKAYRVKYQKDLETLTKFTKDIGYLQGIWLVFGNGNSLDNTIVDKFKNNNILVFHHKTAGVLPSEV